jgi:nitroreductase
MKDKIKNAIDNSQRAQRNYDLSCTVSKSDLETLIYVAKNSPSKQNEIHYKIKVYTDQSVIRQIYNCTKLFSLPSSKPIAEVKDGKIWQDENTSVHNSQILANVLFVYEDDEGPARGGSHKLAQQNPEEQMLNAFYIENKAYSVGVSVGQLILSANLLGYKTGVCSAFHQDKVAEIIKSDKVPKLLVGIGYENVGVNRRWHAETLNKDVLEIARTGELDEPWQFPSFEKHTKVTINGN